MTLPPNKLTRKEVAAAKRGTVFTSLIWGRLVGGKPYL